MRRLTTFAAVVLMLVMMLPGLACAATLASGRTQQDCCHQMHGRCGEMAKQGCCQVAVRSDLSQLPAHVHTDDVRPPATTAVSYAAPNERRAWTGFRWHVPEAHSPPGLLIASTTVLRL